MIGFIGLGTMGRPMALNLVRAGTPLVVWNRSSGAAEALRDAGARVAATPADVFQDADVVMMMLADAAAVDAVLARGTAAFAPMVAGRTVVHMGTTAPEFSRALEADILAAGGRYAEAPMSGSRVPAEAGALLAIVAGQPATVAEVRGWLGPMCRDVVECGAVPNATLAKLASNVVLLTMVTSLAEAVHVADRVGLGREPLLRVVLGGPLASDVLRVKGAKFLANDFAPQASIVDAGRSGGLTQSAARAAGAATPLLDECLALYRQARELGVDGLDMAGVIMAIEARQRGTL